MSESKQNVPKLRFPGFTDPWEQRKLGELASEFKSGEFIRAEKIHKSGPYPVYGGNGLRGYTTRYNHDGLFVLIGRQGALCGNVNIADGKAYFTEHAVAVKGNSSNNTTFLYYLFDTLNLGKYSGQSAQPGLAVNNLVEVVAKVPNRLEQAEIACTLASLDDLITLHQRKLDHLKLQKHGLLQKMFPKDGSDRPEIRFPGFTDPWEQRKLGEMGKTFTGLSGKSKEDFGHGTAGYVTYMNVFSNPIADSDGIEKIEVDDRQSRVQYGDVFFTTSSETPKEVAMSSVWLANRENVYLNSFCFGWRPTVEVRSLYLAFMLRSSVVRKKLTFLAQGISRYNISKAKVMELTVPIPSLEEQAQIGSFFRDLDDLITLHQRKLDHLKLQKKALLQQMFI